MLPQLYILAGLALTAVQAQTAFQFKEQYPEPGVIPVAKPEWLELLKTADIVDAPVLKATANGPGPITPGDPHCDWTHTGCLGADDLSVCPKGEWAPTYDDGPSEFSAALYDALDKTNTKATFFMVGGQVVKFPELTLRAYKSGHELAMHTWSHNYMTTLTNEQLVAELKWNELVIKEVTGVSPRYFRPPYGDIDDRVRSVAKALGFTAVIWSHDTHDWTLTENPSFKTEWIDGNVTQWAKAASTATQGGISLEHDLYKETVEAAIRVLPILQKAYNVTTVGDCSNQPSYKEAISDPKPAVTPAANTTSNPTPAASNAPPSVSDKDAKDTSTPVSQLVKEDPGYQSSPSPT
ncbi:uncharacterized protein BYT42DRAFT_158362 [Radiomyces spectabilis]|uniref:uncharacterized protein n=1 Tax=Radiomyces spectabilis TaxID=64574 RepID=UPI00221EDBDF|nr:uncharacterized protein BYT42DRAFT_158362 [Radiomyces spectabilis]KAI8365263.1 hypothetical protein BYT42DRAFT_158362 [Radiomyces spectabilis]